MIYFSLFRYQSKVNNSVSLQNAPSYYSAGALRLSGVSFSHVPNVVHILNEFVLHRPKEETSIYVGIKVKTETSSETEYLSWFSSTRSPHLLPEKVF